MTVVSPQVLQIIPPAALLVPLPRSILVALVSGFLHAGSSDRKIASCNPVWLQARALEAARPGASRSSQKSQFCSARRGNLAIPERVRAPICGPGGRGFESHRSPLVIPRRGGGSWWAEKPAESSQAPRQSPHRYTPAQTACRRERKALRPSTQPTAVGVDRQSARSRIRVPLRGTSGQERQGRGAAG